MLSAVAVILVTQFLPGVSVDNYRTALLVAVALAFLNAIVKPILTFLTIPITVLSLGLFLLVINALMIIIAERLVPGFNVEGFGLAIVFSIILSLVTWILNTLFGLNNKEKEND